MKKNHNTTNKQSADSLRVTDIPAVIFSVALVARLASNFIPASVGDILRPVSLIVGGVALLAQVVLWICIKIKNKKNDRPEPDGPQHL